MEKGLLKLLFLTILINSFLISCKSKNNNLTLTFYSGKDSIIVKDFLKCKDGGYLYFYLKKSKIKEKLYDELIIDKIILNYENNSFLALPEKVFSSKHPSSELSYVVEQESQKLDYFENEKGRWFFLSENKSPPVILKSIFSICNSCDWERKIR